MHPLANNTHLSIDIETLGTTPGSLILEIAVVEFDLYSGATRNHFQKYLNQKNSLDLSFTTDQKTLKFWDDRGGFPTKETEGASVEYALNSLTAYLDCYVGKKISVWARGKDFELSLLTAAYALVIGTPPPKIWNGFNTLVARDIFNFALPCMRAKNDIHRALPDAITQAQQVALAFRTIHPLPTSLEDLDQHRGDLPCTAA